LCRDAFVINLRNEDFHMSKHYFLKGLGIGVAAGAALALAFAPRELSRSRDNLDKARCKAGTIIRTLSEIAEAIADTVTN
jgi:gas vesicle protein